MKLVLLCFIALTAAMLTPSAKVNASEPVVITYERAVQMAQRDVLAIEDLDALIRNLQMQHNDLRHELRRLESGEAKREALNDLFKELWELEQQILLVSEMIAQTQMSIELSLRELFINIPFAGAEEVDEALSHIFQTSVIGIMSVVEMGGGIALMEMHRNSILEALTEIKFGDVFREMTYEARRGLAEINRQIQGIRMHQEQIRLAVEFGLRSIIALSSDLEMMGETLIKELELAEEALAGMRAMSEIGFVSPHDLFIAEHYIVQFQGQLTELYYSKDSLMQGLNYMIGQPLSQITVIKFERILPEIPDDMASHIATVSMRTPTIRGLQFALESANATWREYVRTARNVRINRDNQTIKISDPDLIQAFIAYRWAYGEEEAFRRVREEYNNRNRRPVGSLVVTDADRRRAMNADSRYSGDTDWLRRLRNRIAMQDAIDRADRELHRTIRTLEVSIRRGYNDLRILILQEAALQRELIRAQADLRMALANYEIGLAIQRDIDEARMAIFRTEQEIEGVINQKWVLGFALDNPSLLLQD